VSPQASTFRISPFTREFIVGCVIFVAVVASRHVTWDFPIELSGDESELLVQIDRYELDPVPWRSVDGSTIGPVNPWFLMLLKKAGWPMTYGAIHFLSALLLGVITVVSIFTVRLLIPLRWSAWVGVAGTFAVVCASSINFMYYATELLPALLLGLAVLVLAWVWQRPDYSKAGLPLAAFIAGIAPWAKLQSAPIALLVCAAAGVLAWVHGTGTCSLGRRLVLPGLVCAAAVLPTAVIVGVVTAGGVLEDFWASYIVANLGYAGEFGVRAALSRLGILFYWSQLNGLMAAVFVLAVLLVVSMRRGPGPADRHVAWTGGFAVLYLAITVYCCVRPPHGFGHYHIFLVGPLFLTIGLLLRAVSRAGGQNGLIATERPGRAAVLCLVVPVFIISGYNYVSGASLRQRLHDMRANAGGDLPAVVTREIGRLAPEASTMVVWGWMPTLYVRTGLLSASRHTISHFLIDPGPSRERLRTQFLEDVVRERPDVVVDAVASDCFVWNWDVPASGIESFPEFAAYVHANYTLALNVIGDQEGVPLRVFVRRTPVAEVE
jgi:hypothetical protein